MIDLRALRQLQQCMSLDSPHKVPLPILYPRLIPSTDLIPPPSNFPCDHPLAHAGFASPAFVLPKSVVVSIDHPPRAPSHRTLLWSDCLSTLQPSPPTCWLRLRLVHPSSLSVLPNWASSQSRCWTPWPSSTVYGSTKPIPGRGPVFNLAPHWSKPGYALPQARPLPPLTNWTLKWTQPKL